MIAYHFTFLSILHSPFPHSKCPCSEHFHIFKAHLIQQVIDVDDRMYICQVSYLRLLIVVYLFVFLPVAARISQPDPNINDGVR